MAASSSSSSSGLGWKYDVFINFRGEDTRRGFVSHLYKALRQKPINTFIDAEDLGKGDHISKLLTAIRDSRLSIVVFSQNYASSTWCLKELVQILECKDTYNQIVLPIFYEVDPSDVRKLKRSFAEAFAQHDRDSNAKMEEVRSWKSALTTATSLSGWNSRNYENDATLIDEIVEDVYRKLIDISSTSSNDDGLVDMDSHMHEQHLLLYPPGGETNNDQVLEMHLLSYPPGAVYGERIRAKNYKDKVLRWQKIPADQHAHLMREKQEHLQKLRIENSMGSSEPTLKQIRYLRSLGCTVAPTSRLHASRLIEQYKLL